MCIAALQHQQMARPKDVPRQRRRRVSTGHHVIDCEGNMNASTVREANEIADAEAAGWRHRLRRRGGGGKRPAAPATTSESLVPRVAGYALLAFVLWLV